MSPRILATIVAVLLAGACSSTPPLANTHSSAESLARATLDAVARRDRTALEALALDEREFRDHVWPALPAARPERNLPFSYVWSDLRQKSANALSGTLARYGGSRYELIDVRFDGVSDYGTYRVHRGTSLRIRDAHGTDHVVSLCGSMIEQDGAWKVFSYVAD